MPAAVVAVHQLRYWLSYGPKATRELGDTGHSYLTSVSPWVVMLVALAAGAFLSRLARARLFGKGPVAAHRRTGRVWLFATVALVAIYAMQEVLEGVFANGHAAGLTGIFGSGGWWSIPAAVVIAGVLALLLRGADVLVHLVGRRRRATPGSRHPADRWPPLPDPLPVRTPPLASAAAGRAPPALTPSS
jgi:hypothetical protein